jgi:uncharacterized membrane protein YbhN (UPF0104 family)
MIRRALSFALGIAIAAAAIWYLATPEIVKELRTVAAGASWPALALAMITGAAVQWLRAWRFAIMTSRRFALPGILLVRITFQLNFLNFVLPFRLGELSYPVLMRRAYGQPILSAAGVLLLARIFDSCSVAAILAGTAAALGLLDAPPLQALLWGAAALLALAPIVLVLGAHALSGWLAAGPGARRLPAALHAAHAALAARPAQLAAIGLSFVIWLAFGALATLAANAVAAIPPTVALLGAAGANIAFALPVNGIVGLGASQAAWVALVSEAGIAWTDAVLSALAVYAVTLAGALVFGGAAMLAAGISRGASRP